MINYERRSGGEVTVQNNGTIIVSAATKLNFIGGVSVTSDVDPHKVNINITGGSSKETTITDIIPALTTKVIDTVPVSGFDLIRYYLNLEYAGIQEGHDINVINKSSDIDFAVFNNIGNNFKGKVDAYLLSGSVYLDYTNNESYDLNVKLLRYNVYN